MWNSKMKNQNFFIALRWFESYLMNIRQYVEFKNEKSEFFYINCGVPQGSILGPLSSYFTLMILLTVLNFTLFADDTNVF